MTIFDCGPWPGAAVYAPDPDAPHGFRLVAKVAPEDWAALAEPVDAPSPVSHAWQPTSPYAF